MPCSEDGMVTSCLIYGLGDVTGVDRVLCKVCTFPLCMLLHAPLNLLLITGFHVLTIVKCHVEVVVFFFSFALD